jgi:hypothetical protein
VEQEVGGSSPPNCTTQNQSLAARRERDCFPEKWRWEAAGNWQRFVLPLRRALALPLYAVALILSYAGDSLGNLAAWIAGDAWPG